MNAYFLKITKEERENILDKHKHVYDGYVTQYVNPNEQPLYVQDFANDKNGVTLSNDGTVSQYNNKIYMKESAEDINIYDDWSTNYKEYEFDNNISKSEADSLIDQLYSRHPEMSKEDISDFVYNNVNIIKDDEENDFYDNLIDDEDLDDENIEEQFDDEFEKNKYPNKNKFNMEKDFPIDDWKKDIDYTMGDDDFEDDDEDFEEDMFDLVEKKENNLQEQLNKTLIMFDRLKKFN
jgi:hypothetical protein